MQTVETAKKYLGSVVCAVDIAGAEGLFPHRNVCAGICKGARIRSSHDHPCG